MKALSIFLLCVLVVCVTADWQKPEWCKEKDCPKFELVNEGNGYDTRKYEKSLWAWTCMKDVEDMPSAVMEAYAMLHAYFHGDNQGSLTIPMTVPVVHNITLHKKDRHGDSFFTLGHRKHRHEKADVGVAFYLPYMYQGGTMNPPQPNNKDIQIGEYHEWHAHVRDFSGWPSPLKFMKEYEKLVEALEDEKEDFLEEWAIFAIYDELYEMDNRHNEILLAEGEEKSDIFDDLMRVWRVQFGRTV